MCADAALCLAAQDGADENLLDAALADGIRLILGDQIALLDKDFVGRGIDDILERIAPDESVLDRLDDLVAVLDVADDNAFGRTAVVLMNDDLLRNIDQTAGEVTRVCRTECGIRKALTRTAGTDEILEVVQTFAEVRLDRDLHRLTVGCEHQTAHAGKLTQLAGITAGT